MDLVRSPSPTNEKEDLLSNSLFKRAKTPANKTTTKLKSYNPKKPHTNMLHFTILIVNCGILPHVNFVISPKAKN